MAIKTLMMIKPDAIENGHIGNILEKVTSAGFKIKALKLTQLLKVMPRLFMLFTMSVLFLVNWSVL